MTRRPARCGGVGPKKRCCVGRGKVRCVPTALREGEGEKREREKVVRENVFPDARGTALAVINIEQRQVFTRRRSRCAHARRAAASIVGAASLPLEEIKLRSRTREKNPRRLRRGGHSNLFPIASGCQQALVALRPREARSGVGRWRVDLFPRRSNCAAA